MSILNIIAFARLGLIHPRLMKLAYQIKKGKKTFLSYQALYSLARNYQEVRRRGQREIEVAEFGVGRGGSAMILAWMVGHYGGRISLYDVFGRIPPPSEIDGERAKERYQAILTNESTNYYGNLPDLLQVIKRDLSTICDPGLIDFIQGTYEQSLSDAKDGKRFGVVHIDCDWYESSKAVYGYLRDSLLPDAIIQVDDYSNWQGSHQAFQEAEWLHHHQNRIVDGALVVDLAT